MYNILHTYARVYVYMPVRAQNRMRIRRVLRYVRVVTLKLELELKYNGGAVAVDAGIRMLISIQHIHNTQKRHTESHICTHTP